MPPPALSIRSAAGRSPAGEPRGHRGRGTGPGRRARPRSALAWRQPQGRRDQPVDPVGAAVRSEAHPSGPGRGRPPGRERACSRRRRPIAVPSAAPRGPQSPARSARPVVEPRHRRLRRRSASSQAAAKGPARRSLGSGSAPRGLAPRREVDRVGSDRARAPGRLATRRGGRSRSDRGPRSRRATGAAACWSACRRPGRSASAQSACGASRVIAS